MTRPNMIRTLIFALIAIAMLLSATAVAQRPAHDDSARSQNMSIPGMDIIVKQMPSGNLTITRTKDKGMHSASGIVIRGRLLMQQGRGGQ